MFGGMPVERLGQLAVLADDADASAGAFADDDAAVGKEVEAEPRR